MTSLLSGTYTQCTSIYQKWFEKAMNKTVTACWWSKIFFEDKKTVTKIYKNLLVIKHLAQLPEGNEC